MKITLMAISIATLFICSCSNMPEPLIIDETSSPSQDELYSQCQELNGIGDLKIGMKYKDAAKNPNWHSSTESTFWKGYWGVENSDEGFWIDRNVSNIKQCQRARSISNDYIVDDISLGEMYLAFLDDVLVGIEFDCPSDKLHSVITRKYGSGKGSIYSYKQENDLSYPKFRCKNIVNINKEWENESVNMTYKFNLEQIISPSEKKIEESHSCLIIDKEKYPLYLAKIEEARAMYKQKKEDSKLHL